MAGTLGTIMGQVRLDVRQAVAAYAALRAQNQRTVYAMRGTGDSFVAAGQRMAFAGGVMVYAFSRVVMAAAEFERQMDYAAAVSGTTGAKMQKLSDYALQLGQDTIYSANEVAEGFIELAKAGVGAEDIINGIGEAMTNLGAAGDIPLAQSGQIITSTIQQYDLAAQDAVKVTDLLAGAANASIADISDLGVSLKYVGGVANAAGLGLEDTMTAISLLAKAGIRGSTAGTSLRQMIVSLGGATGPAREALSELGILAEDGSNKFFDAEGNAKSLSRVFQILQNSTADLTSKQRLMYLRTIFNNRALSAASILTRDGAKGFREMSKEMSKVTAADVAAARLDNLSGDIEILRGNIETLMIKAGSPFQEELRKWVQGITALVQAFADLDPETQTSIMRFMGLSGVALVAMGAFTIFVGMIFRFIAACLKMAAGVKFAARMIRIIGVNVRWAARLLIGPLLTGLAGISSTVLIVVAAVLAFAAAWYLAYTKIEPFRKAVNAWYGTMWNAVKALGSFFKLLATDPGAAWDKIKSGSQDALDWIQSGFKKLPGLIKQGVDKAVDYVQAFAARVGDYFRDLGAKVLSTVTGWVGKVTSLFTFRNVGYAIGFLVGTVTKWFLLLGLKLALLTLTMTNKVTGFFSRLPGKIGYFIGFMAGRAIGLWLRFATKMISLAGRAVTGTIKFFQRLPGRIATFMVTMSARGIALMVNFARRLPSLASQLVTGVVNFIRTLPSRVAAFITTMANRARNGFNRMKTNAINMAKGMVSGFTGIISELPSLVSGVVDNIISAFKDKISAAASSVKDFAKGMWEGFKDGIGMNSPSYFEKAMWQITDTIGVETKKLAKQTLTVQKMSKKMAATSFSVGDPGAPTSADQYRRLASMQAANQKRARTLAANSGNAKARALAASRGRKGRQIEKAKLEITNWRTGQGYFYGLAQEVVDDTDYYDETFERMG